MSVRDRVIGFNQEVGFAFDGFCYRLADGIDWIAPFMPWVVLGTVFLAVLFVCFGL